MQKTVQKGWDIFFSTFEDLVGTAINDYDSNDVNARMMFEVARILTSKIEKIVEINQEAYYDRCKEWR